MTETLHRSAELAAEIIAMRTRPLDDRDVTQLRRLLLDHLGCCYRGACVPWGMKMRQWARQQHTAGDAPLFADSITAAPAIAAFVNATAAHGLELDDTHDESITHPGAPVIAAALALAATRDCTIEEFLAAIVAGYEVIGRVGAATNAAHVVEHGFHPTSLFAGFGVVAVTAAMLQLDAAQLQRAWGLLLSMAGGSMQFSQETVGTTVKRLHGGLAALHGVMAAELAVLGIDGPEQALDGRYGLLNIFGGNQDAGRLNLRHTDAPEIHRVSFKAYPCCRFFHSTLDALREVTREFTTDASYIAKYRVGGPEVLSTQHVVRRPESEMAAQYSLPFALGAASVYGPRSVDGYAESSLQDEQVLAIADRVDVEIDDSLQQQFPDHFGSWLEIKLKDGTVRRAEVLDSIGTPANPMNTAELVAKFDSLVEPVNENLRGADVVHAIESVDSNEALRVLLSRFRANA